MNSLEIALAIANELLPRDPTQKISGSALWSKALVDAPELAAQTVENTFSVKMSQLVQDPNTGVSKDIGQNGYYFVDKPGETDEEDLDRRHEESNEDPPEEPAARNQQERLLYPIFKSYLVGKGYQADITADMKKLGRWGNPDVIGIRIDEGVDGNEVYEFVSIEAKIDVTNWRYNIFEAVSHRRFVNRSYFAFAAPLKWLSQNHDEMRYYSELFSVGVMVAAMTQEDFDAYRNANIKSLDGLSIDVFEIYSAPYEIKQPRWQRVLLEGMGLTRASEVALFGRGED